MKTKFISIAATLLLAASTTSTFALSNPDLSPASWVGKSAVRINTNWYYCGTYLNWCKGVFKDDADLGELAYLNLGGQSQAYNRGDNPGNTELNWAMGTPMTMWYKIDNNEPNSIELTLHKWNVDVNDQGSETSGNNMLFESSDGVDIDLSDFRDDNTYHYITVWFQSGNAYDNNTWEGVAYNYRAKFKAVSPTADWVGKSAINVNGTWYYAGEDLYWGGQEGQYNFFGGNDLGEISALYLGGQSQIYDGGLNWEEGEMNMYYMIDGNDPNTITLTYYSFNNNNMFFQSGGREFEDTYIDVSELGKGTHSLAVWFERDGVYDNKENKQIPCYYTANFTVKEPKTIENSSDFSEVNEGDDVKISGLTLYKNTEWFTLCLPFSLTQTKIETSPLAGARIFKLYNSILDDYGELTLSFLEVSSVTAGEPYFVRWETAGENVVDPIFTGVTIPADVQAGSSAGEVTFKGTFNETTIYGQDYLYLGAGNTLYWPNANVTINPFHAYFELNLPAQIKSFVLNFDDDNETTSIKTISESSDHSKRSDVYYTLDGRRLNDKPATAGLYIINGKKVVIK